MAFPIHRDHNAYSTAQSKLGHMAQKPDREELKLEKNHYGVT